MSVGRWRPRGDPLAKTPRPQLGSPSQASFPRPVPVSPFPGVCFLAPAGTCPPESHRAPRASTVICPRAWPPPPQTLTSPRRQPYQVRTKSSPCPASSKPRIPPFPDRGGPGTSGTEHGGPLPKLERPQAQGSASAAMGPGIGQETRGLRKCGRGAEQRLRWERGRTVPEKHSSSPARVPRGAQPRTAGHRGGSVSSGSWFSHGARRAS